jgi:hypothetical protein
MENNVPKNLEQLLTFTAAVRRDLELHEEEWKELRAASRRYTLSLIVDHGYSVNKAALVTGHNRGVITAWLAADGIRTRR